MPVVVADLNRKQAEQALEENKNITCIIRPSSNKDSLVVSAVLKRGEKNTDLIHWEFSLGSLESVIGKRNLKTEAGWKELEGFIKKNLTSVLKEMEWEAPNLKQEQIGKLQEILSKEQAIINKSEEKSSLFKTPEKAESQKTTMKAEPPRIDSFIYYAKMYVNEFSHKLASQLNVEGLGSTVKLQAIYKREKGYELQFGPEGKSIQLDDDTVRKYAEDRMKSVTNFLKANKYRVGSSEDDKESRKSYNERLSYLPKEIQKEILTGKTDNELDVMKDSVNNRKNSSSGSDKDRYQSLHDLILSQIEEKKSAAKRFV